MKMMKMMEKMEMHGGSWPQPIKSMNKQNNCFPRNSFEEL